MPCRPDRPYEHRRRQRSALLMLTVAALSCLALCGCGKNETTLKVISSLEEPIMGMQKLEPAAAAWVVRHLGLADEGETDTGLYTALRLHIGIPECASCPMIVFWDVAGGLMKYFSLEDRPEVQIRELMLRTAPPELTGDWSDYVDAIDRDQPVIVSWCYDKPAGIDEKLARARAAKCMTGVGIGYILKGDERFVIFQHGLDKPMEYDIDATDRVTPSVAGVSGQDGPWHRPSTALYRWDGDYENLIMVFVEPAEG